MKVAALIFVCVFLAAFLLAIKFTPSGKEQKPGTMSGSGAAAAGHAEIKANAVFSEMNFNWASAESPDFSTLIANLRQIQCPEATIIDIVEGRLKESCRPRFRAALRAAFRLPAQMQMRQRMTGIDALRQEIDHTMYSLLGLQRQPRSAGVLFTAQEERRIAEARQHFEPIQIFGLSDTNLLSLSQANRHARIEILARQFSADKLVLYRLDREEGGEAVNAFFQFYRPTEDQFMTLAKALYETNPDGVFNGLTPETEAALRPLLSAELFDLIKDLKKDEIIGVMFFGRQNGLPPETINKLVEARRGLTKDDVRIYLQNVKIYLADPDVVNRYLSDKQIHPDTFLQ